MSEFEKIQLKTIRFMRGRYQLDEVAGTYHTNQCIKYREKEKTILSLILHEDHLEFLIIYGKKEQEKFEKQRSDFSKEIQNIYDYTKTLQNGKHMLIRVDRLETLIIVEKMIQIKKKPNRKPLPKDDVFWGKCGHRCDLCVHFTGIKEEFRNMLIPHLISVYGITDWDMRCTGCDTPGCQCYAPGFTTCLPLDCIKQNRLNSCKECPEYPCEEATVGYKKLEAKNMSKDDITWAVLPYVPDQYGN